MDITKPLPLIDVQAHREHIGDAVDDAIAKVLAHGKYIMGPEVEELETALSTRTHGRKVISCGNGTDAMHLCLRAFDIKPRDAIFVPAFTFAATAEVVCLAGGTPVFVDINPETYNISAQSLEDSINMVRDETDLRATGVISVDLFGRPAEYETIENLTNKYSLWLLEDAAQSFGAAIKSRPCGAFGLAATTSFFPAKPLGTYGDGGAIFVDDEKLEKKLRSLRSHGMGGDKYENIQVGMNSRLDTIQAAILLEKLRLFDSEIASRERTALRYNKLLGNSVITPIIDADTTNVWAQYTIQTAGRKVLKDALEKVGIPTAIYYPHVLPDMPAYSSFPVAPEGIPAAIHATTKVLSLPMHAYLKENIQNDIVTNIKSSLEATK